MNASIQAVLITLTLVLSSAAGAHEMSMAELQIRQLSAGKFMWQWMAGERRPPGEVLAPIWPEGCREEDNLVRCGEDGLAGELTIRGVGNSYSAAVVKVLWADGQSSVYTLTPSQPTARLYGSADDRRGFAEIAAAYTRLGVEHILTGVDHLLFVIGLLFLVGFNRRLIWTITAFTAAHSVTLALSALGWLVLRPPPVEASIALSIVLVASEAMHREQTLARRWPALVAFLFGLIHGLGFAGALKEIGLPENHLLAALLTFNMGVELGQLMTVALAYVLWRIGAGWPLLEKARTAALYSIGAVAAFWSWERIVAIFG